MPDSFYRVSQSLRKDSGIGSTIGISIASILLVAWLAWSFKAQITLYETSQSARLEVSASAYPIQSAAAGMLRRSSLSLGRTVQAGDVLAEIDSTIEELNLNQQRTALANLDPEIAALDAQASSERAGATEDHQILKFSSDTAAAQFQQAEAEAQSAEEDARRAQQLKAEGIFAAADADRLAATARAKRSAAEALRSAASQLAPQLNLRERDREVRLKQILEQKARLLAERASDEAAVARLQEQIEHLRIRTPVGGRIAECAQLLPGSHIAEGQQLAVVLPPGGMRVVSDFSPFAALGKIHPGQTATIRLEGFPWGQYGTVSARVSKVADEIHDGRVRVELAVVSVPPRIHPQHGIPGSVEVAVEQTSPAAMLLRSAGALLGGH